MAIDPDVQVLIDELKARIEALEAAPSGSLPKTIVFEDDAGTQTTWVKQ